MTIDSMKMARNASGGGGIGGGNATGGLAMQQQVGGVMDPLDRWVKHEQPDHQISLSVGHTPSSTGGTTTGSNSSTSDVISMQYMELEEFLLENAVNVVSNGGGGNGSGSDAGKGTFDHSSPSPTSSVASEKQYQVNLEQRPYDLQQQQQQQPQLGVETFLQQQQQHQNTILPDQNSPPQSHCDSPPQLQQQQQQPQQQQQTLPHIPNGHPIMSNNTVARKSTYPTSTGRRESTSSSSNGNGNGNGTNGANNGPSLVVTPPHTPSLPLPSPPLPPTAAASAGLVGLPDRSAAAVAAKARKAIKRNRKEAVPDESKDDKYWKRRAKNNEAAKRSRDLRREKENQIMQRVAFLERQNQILQQELTNLGGENEELRKRLSRYEQV